MKEIQTHQDRSKGGEYCPTIFVTSYKQVLKNFAGFLAAVYLVFYAETVRVSSGLASSFTIYSL